MRTYDITGAFLHEIFREGGYYGIVDPKSAQELIKLRPELKQGLRQDRTLIVRIVKALYGLEESAKLFYNMITNKIKQMGYERTDVDPYT